MGPTIKDAVKGIEDELNLATDDPDGYFEAGEATAGEDYRVGYRQALKDTISNLIMLAGAG